jgi:hypothetical protein
MHIHNWMNLLVFMHNLAISNVTFMSLLGLLEGDGA